MPGGDKQLGAFFLDCVREPSSPAEHNNDRRLMQNVTQEWQGFIYPLR